MDDEELTQENTEKLIQFQVSNHPGCFCIIMKMIVEAHQHLFLAEKCFPIHQNLKTPPENCTILCPCSTVLISIFS